MSREIPITHEIDAYFHCRECVNEVKAIIERTGQPQSPATYQRLEAGYTPIGLQVWCRRHNINIIHLDFEGRKHPANTRGVAAED